LDIDKIERYPITFVVKSNETLEILMKKTRSNALKTCGIEAIVEKYMSCIENLINIPDLENYLKIIQLEKGIKEVLDEIVLQSRVEFNFDEENF
jgi:hypothetical protein